MLTEHDPDQQPGRCYKRPTKCLGVAGSVWCFRKRTDHLAFGSLVSGAVFLICAFVLPAILNGALNDGVADMLIMDSPSSDSYAGWEDTTGDPNAPKLYYDLCVVMVTRCPRCMRAPNWLIPGSGYVLR